MLDTKKGGAADPTSIEEVLVKNEPSSTQENSQPQAKSPLRLESIPLDAIKDGGAQMRVEMRADTVNEYAHDMLNDVVFPPVVVFYDDKNYWLGDGFHRVGAARKIGNETIVAEIREGSAREAVLHGVGSNASHGLRRSQADKRRAVERLLKDPEWLRWSDRKIAEIAKVDHKTVGSIRRELAGELPTPNMSTKGHGEFPTTNVKPTTGTSLLANVLSTIPDSQLVAECRRRGLTVEAADA